MTAYFLTHPIQYQAPMIRRLTEGGMSLHVIYGYNPADGHDIDPGFGLPVSWDIPLLHGYSHEFLGRKQPLPSLPPARFWEMVRQSEDILMQGRFKQAWIHGWGNPMPMAPFFAAAAMIAARRCGLPILLRGETHRHALRGGSLRRLLHRLVMKRVFRRVNAFLAIGSANASFYREYGVPAERIFSMPHAVDNEFFQSRCREAEASRNRFRREHGCSPDDVLVMFCGRLAREKDPLSLIRSISLLRKSHPELPVKLVMVGEGPMRQEVERLVAAERLAEHVRLTGFKNQTELPAYYSMCDVFVLPSVFEPWGLVVNEAMNAGKPVLVGEKVGCGPDLVMPGRNGGIFPDRDPSALAASLLPYLQSREKRLAAGQESLKIISRWSFAEDLAGLRTALDYVERCRPALQSRPAPAA